MGLMWGEKNLPGHKGIHHVVFTVIGVDFLQQLTDQQIKIRIGLIDNLLYGSN